MGYPGFFNFPRTPVIALLFLGVATPSESAALGCLAACILGIIQGGFGWIKKSIMSSLKVTVMSSIIITGATAFSQILAYSGASRGMLESVTGFGFPPILLIVVMMLTLVVLGGPMDEISLMMISLPIYIPIITALGFDPVWFGVLVLLNVEIALLSPPFGMVLFVMKGVASPDTTMGDIFKSAMPFVCIQAVAIGLLIAFPKIAMWLPSLMK
ncbi:MAG: TRAP transporter large permease subunit [Desulfobacterales bacterium]|nr:TRAP transporter large permease subunit [Desulfobacterales bacterium]